MAGNARVDVDANAFRNFDARIERGKDSPP